MPELPEVEVTRLSLAGRLTGARIEAVQLGKPLRWPLGASAAMLVGAKIGPMLRRGKYLWLPLLRPGAGPVGPAGVDVRPVVVAIGSVRYHSDRGVAGGGAGAGTVAVGVYIGVPQGGGGGVHRRIGIVCEGVAVFVGVARVADFGG